MKVGLGAGRIQRYFRDKYVCLMNFFHSITVQSYSKIYLRNLSWVRLLSPYASRAVGSLIAHT